MLLEPGTRIGPYVVTGVLGGGGMGDVYEGRDTRLDRRVAIKTLRRESLAEPEARKRFEREARALSALNHPGICTVFDVGQHDGVDYIVMELVEGETLAAVLERRVLDERTLVAYAARIADALAEAHDHGVLHRDIKPHNVMVTRRGAKLLDFGLAKPIATVTGGEQTVSAVTGVAAVSGTVPYMSPEQIKGEALDGRSDAFSLGVLMYESVTGRRPFGGATPGETMGAILHAEPAPITGSGAGVSAELQRIVRKCLQKDRSQRYQTLRDLATDLEALHQQSTPTSGATTSALPPARVRRGPRRVLLAALAIAAAAILGAGWAWMRRPAGTWSLEGRPVAILPLKPLSSGVAENYFGLGIADALITRLSASSGLRVRPTSAIRKYVTSDVDALGAAAELGVDAVLDGTWQREGDRVRLTMNLLRVSDGVSLWAHTFDLPFGDVFSIQDRVSDQLGSSLQLALEVPGSRDRPGPRQTTTNPEAYELYLKGLFYISDRGYNPKVRQNSDRAIEVLERAVALDPRYAEAHAKLGFALAHTAMFIEDNPALIARAKDETATADRLSPGMAQVHLNRAFILWSWYEGWKIVDAIREYRRALTLDASLTDVELVAAYMHLGMVEEWRRAGEQLIARDPTNRSMRVTHANEFYLLNLQEEGLAFQRRWLNEGPDARYYLGTRRLAEAAPLVEADAASQVDNITRQSDLALLRALQGRHDEARVVATRVAALLARNRYRHHMTYVLARVAALRGDEEETARWLEETIAWGFPCYPVFSTDPALDRVRRTPRVQQILAQLKTDWDGYREALHE